MRGWVGEETPGSSADASEGRRKSRGVKGGGGAGGKRELADVGMSSPKPR